MSLFRRLKGLLGGTAAPSAAAPPSPQDRPTPGAAAEEKLLAPLLAALAHGGGAVAGLQAASTLLEVHREALRDLAATDPARAVTVLRRYLAEAPAHAPLLWILAQVYQESREIAAAMEIYQRLSQSESERAAACACVAALYEHHLGDSEQAVRCYQQAWLADMSREDCFAAALRLQEDRDENRAPPLLVLRLEQAPEGIALLHPIGRGGSGTVFLGQDQSLGRQVAVKFLHPHLRRDARAMETFLAEARLAASFNHPRILPIYDIDPAKGALVMAYLAHGSLADRLRAQVPIAPEAAWRCCAQVAEALSELHLRGVIHRDVKPANILFSAPGEAVLSDFGIAHFDEAAQVVGTRLYAPPELALHGRVDDDARRDNYALGLLLAEMLSGEAPPLHLELRAQWLAAAGTKVPEALAGLIAGLLQRLCAPDVSQRLRHTPALAQVLRQPLQAELTSALSGLS